jgi:alkylation response protein AidB-like acyl-CoA dehydrogenase
MALNLAATSSADNNQPCPVLSAKAALAAARDLATEFVPRAAHRDRYRALPFYEVERLSASRLLAITVPSKCGGAELPPSIVAEVLRILAAADPNIAQIPHSHFGFPFRRHSRGSHSTR